MVCRTPASWARSEGMEMGKERVSADEPIWSDGDHLCLTRSAASGRNGDKSIVDETQSVRMDQLYAGAYGALERNVELRKSRSVCNFSCGHPETGTSHDGVDSMVIREDSKWLYRVEPYVAPWEKR